MPQSGETSLAQAMVLFMSMGFSFAGSIVAALLIGRWLVARTGHDYWMPIMLVVGLASAISVVWRLLLPFMKARN